MSTETIANYTTSITNPVNTTENEPVAVTETNLNTVTETEQNTVTETKPNQPELNKNLPDGLKLNDGLVIGDFNELPAEQKEYLVAQYGTNELKKEWLDKSTKTIKLDTVDFLELCEQINNLKLKKISFKLPIKEHLNTEVNIYCTNCNYAESQFLLKNITTGGFNESTLATDQDKLNKIINIIKNHAFLDEDGKQPLPEAVIKVITSKLWVLTEVISKLFNESVYYSNKDQKLAVLEKYEKTPSPANLDELKKK